MSKPDAERFFFVSFVWTSADKSGHGSIWGKSNCYPSSAWIKEEAARGTFFSAENVVVTNIIEMNGDDFAAFTAA